MMRRTAVEFGLLAGCLAGIWGYAARTPPHVPMVVTYPAPVVAYAAERPTEDLARVVYVTSQKGRPYHRKECPTIRHAKVSPRSLKAARAGGRMPCQKCNP